MKSIQKHITMILLAFITLGCNDRLEIAPQETITKQEALQTSSDIESLLTGAYDALSVRYTTSGAASGDLYGGNLMRNTELLAAGNELFWIGTFVAPAEIFEKNILVNNEQAENMWLQAYNAINITNVILANLAIVDEDVVKSVEGQARFIRGSVYFELVRLYARAWTDGDPASNPGVPLVLQPTDNIEQTQNVSRASVDQVYAQINKDLTLAMEYLGEQNGVLASRGSAQAMLSRVYLMQQNYADAAKMADSVIESNVYALNTSYQNCFNQTSNSSEDIFAIQITSQDGINEMNTYFAAIDFSGRGDIVVTEEHLAIYQEGDQRLSMFYQDPFSGDTYTTKWNNRFANIGIIRLSEMYLTRAETNFRQGTEIGAKPADDVNVVRQRSGLNMLQQVTVDDILQERHKELAFEGHTLHDLKRTQSTIAGLSYDDVSLVFPIPQREIDANPALKGRQNPGYAQ